MRISKIIALLLVAAMLAACGGSQPTATPMPPAPVQPTARPTVVSQQAPTLQPTTPLGAPTSEPEEYDFSQTSSLDKLDSYRATYSWKWSETKDGVTTTGFWDVLEEFSKADSARHVVWSGTEGSFDIIYIGQYTYMKSADGTWTSMLTSDSDFLSSSAFLSDPLSLVAGQRGRLLQRGVSVNGVTADHYALAESSSSLLLLGVPDRASGDVYVSPELQIVVKYNSHYEGKSLAIRGGSEGVLDTTFDLTDINKPVKIVAPEGVAPPIPEDIPIVEGATELSAIAGIVTYKTTRSVAEMTDFYNEAMPRAGWQAGQSIMEGLLSFEKGERQASVMIQAESGVTTVTVMAQ